MIITDEMVERAWEAFEALPMDAHYSQAMRAALEAVAPMLIAQGMREREALLGENARLVGIIDFMTAANAMQAEGRAQELDPK